MSLNTKHILEFKRPIIAVCQFARENLAQAGESQRAYCNQVRKLTTVSTNDVVLILLPKRTDTTEIVAEPIHSCQKMFTR